MSNLPPYVKFKKGDKVLNPLTGTGGFVVTLGYIRDGHAYYHISMDADLLHSKLPRDHFSTVDLSKVKDL